MTIEINNVFSRWLARMRDRRGLLALWFLALTLVIAGRLVHGASLLPNPFQ